MDRLLVRDFSLLWRAIFALTVSYSAFLAEVFRAGLQAIDRGIIEAGQSLGLSNWQVLRFIIAPQAVRIITPPLGNEFIAMVKDSALVSVLGVQDITQLGKLYSSSTFLFFPTYNMVTFIYLTITISLSLAVRYFEKKLNRFEQRS